MTNGSQLAPDTLKSAQGGLKGEALQVLYAPLPLAIQWERNAKLHDFALIQQSIYQHGFKDPPKWEPLLNGGKGGIVEGNGRCEVLGISQDEGKDPPRGILTNDVAITAGGQMWEPGTWFVPILFGVDADSQQAAEAYGVDHNNLVMAGGDFAPTDIAMLYDLDKYQALLDGLDEIEPVSVDIDTINAEIQAMRGFMMPDPEDVLDERGGEPQEKTFWPKLTVTVHPETLIRYESLMDSMHGADFEKIDRLLQCVDTAVLHLAKPGAYLRDKDETDSGDEEE